MQPIIGCVVDASIAECRAELIAFASMIVDDIENNLDPGIVQSRDGAAKGIDAVAGCETLLGREKVERIVVLVIPQAAIGQMAIIEEGMHRQ